MDVTLEPVETLRDRIKAVPIERIKSHLRDIAWNHAKAEQKPVIADGVNMAESVLIDGGMTSAEAAKWCPIVRFTNDLTKKCLRCITTAEKTAFKQRENSSLKYYDAKSQARIRAKEKAEDKYRRAFDDREKYRQGVKGKVRERYEDAI